MTSRPKSNRARPVQARPTSLPSLQRQSQRLGATRTRASKTLDWFPNPRPGRAYEIRFECPEFTCLCPKTGQPDFATFRIRYTPEAKCVELKSLKLYLWSFRDEGHFHEDVTNRILDDLVSVLAPRQIVVEGDFLVRGGIHTVVEARYPDVSRPDA